MLHPSKPLLHIAQGPDLGGQENSKSKCQDKNKNQPKHIRKTTSTRIRIVVMAQQR